MLKTGLSHGVAVVPNPPKERYNCPKTGAHFEFNELCRRVERLKKLREDELNRTGERHLKKDLKGVGVRQGTSKRLDQIIERGVAEENKSVTTYHDDTDSVEGVVIQNRDSKAQSVERQSNSKDIVVAAPTKGEALGSITAKGNPVVQHIPIIQSKV